MKLKNHDKIAVIGAGPAGSMFAYFLKKRLDDLNLAVEIDIYEEKDFTVLGPKGCNKCGGIVSESLVQLLASEGIIIDERAIQKGIENYVMHTDVGSVSIINDFAEKRIASVYRGGGPRKAKNVDWMSFDYFLLNEALKSGANLVKQKVTDIKYLNDKIVIKTKENEKAYDFVAVAVGMNYPFLDKLEKMGIGYKKPKKAQTMIREIELGEKFVKENFGDSMHVFLLDIPKLKFAAIIPKKEFATVVLLGEIDNKLIDNFFEHKTIKKLFPKDFDFKKFFGCACAPLINVKGAKKPYANRLVVIGDSGISKLYKNGIGAAYYTAKAAVNCVAFYGIDEKALKKYFYPICRNIEFDNQIGKVIFGITTIVQKVDFLKRGLVRVLQNELNKDDKLASSVFWDIFTGSSDYVDILKRALSFQFLIPAIKESIVSIFNKKDLTFKISTNENKFGKKYKNGNIIVKEGEEADKMFLILEGEVDVFKKENNKDIYLATLKKGEVFGEQALFKKGKRNATVKAKGDVRVISIDKKILVNRMYTDPSLVLQIVKSLINKLTQANKKINSFKEVLNEKDFEEVVARFQKCSNLPMTKLSIIPKKENKLTYILDKLIEYKNPTTFITKKENEIIYFLPFESDYDLSFIDTEFEIKKL